MKERSKAERIELRKRKRRFLAFIIAMLIGCLPTATAFAESLPIVQNEDFNPQNYVGKPLKEGEYVSWTPTYKSGGQLIIYMPNNETMYKPGVGEGGLSDANPTATVTIPGQSNKEYITTEAKVTNADGGKNILAISLKEIYTVTFDPNGGTVSQKTGRTDKDGKLASLPNPTWTGHDFKGWFTKTTGGDQITTNTVFESNTTVYAHWEDSTAETVTVTFEANGGSGEMVPQTVNKGEAATLIKNEFTRDGYTFKNWNTKADGSGVSYADEGSININENMLLYAQWEKEEPGPEPTPEDEYTITYRYYGFDGDSKKVLDGVKNNNPSKYKKGESVSLSDPSKSGYKFDAWYDKTFSTKTTGISAGAVGNKEFYAKFIKDKSGGDDDDDDDDDDDAQPFKPNPDALIAFYYLKNGTLDPKAKIGKEVQGAAANAAFKMAVPAGWKEAFTFSMSNEDKHTYTLKDGTIKLYVPEGFQKAGRKYAILAMGQNGAVKLLSDTDTLPYWITVNPNMEGYAFELIYMD